MRNGRKIANHACMNIRLTSKASAGKQNFCPAEAFLLTLQRRRNRDGDLDCYPKIKSKKGIHNE